MNDFDKQHRPADDRHTGYDPEQGLLARAREWTDVFPWLRLARTLRVTGSPVMVGMVAVTWMIWWSMHSWFTADLAVDVPMPDPESPLQVAPTLPTIESVLRPANQYLRVINPMSVFTSTTNWLLIVWGLLAWMPVTLFLVRQGALLTAGRDLASFVGAVRQSLRRSATGLLVSVVPLACVLVFGLLILAAGLVSRPISGIGFLEVPLALFLVVVALPCGLLGFGAVFAVPLAWAALANEQAPDALDALSRGYEYLYRRPLQIALYLLLSIGILVVITAMAAGIAYATGAVCVCLLTIVGASEEFCGRVLRMIQYYPTVIVITLGWALVGSVYLLLRHDAGEQEVEDVWQPAPSPKPPLPELPVAAEV